MADDVDPDEHVHDWRRNPFVIYQIGSTPHDEIVCADVHCPGRYLRPTPGSAWGPQTWPKA